MMQDAWWAPFGSTVLLAYLRQKLRGGAAGALPAYRGAAATPSASALGRLLDAWFGRDVAFLGRKPGAQ